MRRLHHRPFDAASRMVRILLAEKRLEFELVDVNEEDLEFGNFEVPLLEEDNGDSIPYLPVIVEYLEEAYPTLPMIGDSLLDKAEVRRLTHIFSSGFSQRVTEPLVFEKIIKPSQKIGQADPSVLRTGYQEQKSYLDYISWLYEQRNWLAGGNLSMADIAAAAQVSLLDYAHAINWDEYPGVKDWYMRFKSRPSMRTILTDFIPGTRPPSYYAELDF